MKLIFGGAYQGKREYAIAHFDGQDIVNDFHLKILELIKQGIDPITYVKTNIKQYENKVILCDDISCGIVPIDQLMRQWREDTGRVLGYLSSQSDEVIRLFCGIGTKLK